MPRKSVAVQLVPETGAEVAQLVVASKLKEAFKALGMNSSTDIIDGVNAEVHTIVARAVERAKANQRATVRPVDL
jgi:hypothetical protein